MSAGVLRYLIVHKRLTELVEYTLSTSRVPVTVACDTGINIVVVDIGIDQGLDASLESEL